MEQAARDVKSALDHVRASQQRGVVLRDIADGMGVAESTISRWLSGARAPTGESLRSLLEWHRKHTAAPVDPGVEYERGVRYACEAMARTLALLLGEQREREDAARVKQAAKAAPAPTLPTGGPIRRGKGRAAPSTAPLPAGTDSG